MSELLPWKKSDEIIARYPVGLAVTVHYNPDKPEDAVLETVAQGGTLSLVLGIIMMVLGIALAVIALVG